MQNIILIVVVVIDTSIYECFDTIGYARGHTFFENIRTTNKILYIFFIIHRWSCTKKGNNNNNVINKYKLLGRLCALQIISKHDYEHYERFPLIIKKGSKR